MLFHVRVYIQINEIEEIYRKTENKSLSSFISILQGVISLSARTVLDGRIRWRDNHRMLKSNVLDESL